MEDPSPQQPEVKSLTFVTLRKVLSDTFEAETIDAIREGLDPQTRDVLDNVGVGQWVPEDFMAQMMEAIYRRAFAGDDDKFIVFARTLGSEGVSRFLRIFLSLVSARFILRRVPVVWDHLRRGAGCVVAEKDEFGVRIRYAGFPFFGRPEYRLLSLANCQALVLAATGDVPRGAVESWSEDTLVLQFDLRAAG